MAGCDPVKVRWCPDDDGDGYPSGHDVCIESIDQPIRGWIRPRADGAEDCNDNRAEVNPGQAEVCGVNPATGEACLDEDCDDRRDCGDPDCSSNPACFRPPTDNPDAPSEPEPCRWWPQEPTT